MNFASDPAAPFLQLFQHRSMRQKGSTVLRYLREEGRKLQTPDPSKVCSASGRQRMLKSKFSIRSLPLSALDHVLHVDHKVLDVDHLRPFSINSCHTVCSSAYGYADEQTVVTRLKKHNREVTQGVSNLD